MRKTTINLRRGAATAAQRCATASRAARLQLQRAAAVCCVAFWIRILGSTTSRPRRKRDEISHYQHGRLLHVMCGFDRNRNRFQGIIDNSAEALGLCEFVLAPAYITLGRAAGCRSTPSSHSAVSAVHTLPADACVWPRPSRSIHVTLRAAHLATQGRCHAGAKGLGRRSGGLYTKHTVAKCGS